MIGEAVRNRSHGTADRLHQSHVSVLLNNIIHFQARIFGRVHLAGPAGFFPGADVVSD